MNNLTGLYLITPDWDDTDRLVAVSELALQGGARLLQYRHKTADMKLRQQQAAALLAVCRRYGRPFIVNDHIELCLELDADGVHVGALDSSVKHARATLGPHKIIGASCYGDLQLARTAQQQGASYVAFGGFYPSKIKKYPVTTPHSIIAQAKSEIGLPIVVIGGMTQENCLPFIAAGADMVAAISSVYFADDPAVTANEFTLAFRRLG